jgi:hypothetical protein
MSTESVDTPSPEFRAHLEWEVARAFRREASLRSAVHETRRRRRRAAVAVAICLALGTVSSFATAQVRDGTRRDSLLQAARAEVEMAQLRQDLARRQYEEMARKVQAGVTSAIELRQMQAELQAMIAKVARTRLNVEEIQAAALPPRDELNAPLVKGRDYVRLRIEAELSAAQQRTSVLEQQLAEVERQRRVGMTNQLTVSETQVAVERAQHELGLLAEKLRLRQEALEKKTPMDRLMIRLDSTQAVMDVEMAARVKDVAAARLEQMRKQRATGAISELDLMRAEVEFKERELELANLRDRVAQAIAKARARAGGSEP